MRLGIIARADKTGLGNQTRNLVEMLNPDKVLVIDSTPFNGNKQYFDFFYKYNAYKVRGFMNHSDIIGFTQGITHVLSCEIFYNNDFVDIVRPRGVKTFLQYNYEFFENFKNRRLGYPDYLLAPSLWNFDIMESVAKQHGSKHVHLPPPINENNFKLVREHNLKRSGKKKFLHILGKPAMHDRNGTLDLLAALKHTDSDFELHIKSQRIPDFSVNDPRVVIDLGNPEKEEDLYLDYDAVILPRRYAGLCLPMNEGLMSGLPVIMTDVDPNNKVLPREWLVTSVKTGSFFTRTNIDIYSANHEALASKIDELVNKDLSEDKDLATKLAMERYSYEALRSKYIDVINENIKIENENNDYTTGV